MEQQADQVQNINIQQQYGADVEALDNISLVGFFANCFKQITSIIPKFNFHANQRKSNLSNPAKPVENIKEIGILKKLYNNLSQMEVTETKLLSPKVKIRDQETAQNSAEGDQAKNDVEQKAALIPNPGIDIVGLVDPRYRKSSDSCLLSPRIKKSCSCAQELEPFGPTPECHKINLKTAPISSERCAHDKKIYLNLADVNRHTRKLTTLIQTMMTDVLNLTQTLDTVLIDGVSFTLSVDIRRDKQVTKDSTQFNDGSGSISKQMVFKFKEVLPTMECNNSEKRTDIELLPDKANKQELSTSMTTRIQNLPQDEKLYSHQFLAVEKKEKISSLAYEVFSDDTLFSENATSIIDLTCYDELNKQETMPIKTTSTEEVPLDKIFHGDQLLADEEEEKMSSMADGVCSDDTLTLQNGISVFHLTCFEKFKKQELKPLETINIEELPLKEILHGDQLLVDEKNREMFSLADGVRSDDTLTLENALSIDDLTYYDKQAIKPMETTSKKELPQNEILHGDTFYLFYRKAAEEEELSSMADEENSNDILSVEERISILDLRNNQNMPTEDEKEIDGFILNNELIEIECNAFNNELIEIANAELSNNLIKNANTQINNEFIELATAELYNELIEKATIERNAEPLEIKSKNNVKQCSAIKITEKRRSTNDVNEASLPEHSTLKIKLSVSKYCSVTEDFLNILSTLGDTPDDGSMKSTIMVPAFYFRIWHFQNLRQGFLLNIMLRKANVSTLNFMRNLYFVIITTESPSISIAINFAIQNEIFLHCKEPSFHYKGDYCKCTVSPKEVQQIFSPETGIVESCTTYEEGNSNNTDIQSQSDLSSRYSTLIAGKISAATSYLYFDMFDKQQRVDVAVGESEFEIQSDINFHDMYKYRYQTWFTGMLNAPKREMDTFFNYDLNETLFEQFSIDRYMESISGKSYSSFYSSASNSNVYSIFLKCFGHTIACTMLSFFISML